jgi:selenocysteine lyase/cysteine desulfurase
MVEVTQADREAAASVAVLSEIRELILSGRADHHAEPFARHRLAEREAVVKWLREQDGHGYDDMRANCIEAGEHLK